MSRKMLVVAAVALMAPVAVAQAQLPLKFGVAAGASMPSGDFKTGSETGYHVMATAGVHPPLAPVGFRVDGMFNEFGDKEPSTEKTRVLALTANAVFSMPGAVVLSPYAIGGVGMYNSKNTGATEGQNDLGVNIGAGIKFGLAGFSAFGEARFHHIFQEEVAGVTPKFRFIPISFGIMF